MVASKFGRLDVLINNAAISNDSRLADAGVSARAVFMEQFVLSSRDLPQHASYSRLPEWAL
jgi:NAD(P)-dependent dehydrogenase (short-subunit alcohol dehydrogenase family)